MKDNLKEKIIIEEVGVCDSFEIGNWPIMFPCIKLGYTDTDYKSKYSDICYYLKKNDIILGYFMAHNKVVIDKNDIIPIYSRKLIIYDFSVDGRSYLKFGKMLFDFLITFAKNNGYSGIEIKKIEKYNYFNTFLTKNYQVKEFNNSYYLLIDNPIETPSQKYLQIFDDEKIKIEELYFLYNLEFIVSKDDVQLELNNHEFIKIDRKTGKISFPSNVKILSDDVCINSDTKSLVHLIFEMNKNEIKNFKINYSLKNPNFFEAYDEDTVYVNKTIKSLLNDPTYAQEMIDKGIKYLYSYIINYDMDDFSFIHYGGKITCDEVLKKIKKVK